MQSSGSYRLTVRQGPVPGKVFELAKDVMTIGRDVNNDLVINDYADIPLVDRKSTSSKAKTLTGPDLRAFDNETWNIAEWKKA